MSVYSCPAHQYLRKDRPGTCDVRTLVLIHCSSCASPRPKKEVSKQCVCGGELSVSYRQCGKALRFVEDLAEKGYRTE